ncbi:hypothetical protein NDU88_003694 [Pleurodeles waltl]|uniref:Uncharacterized protein n=1 Tax=Pleurodeles waltl TaxID=8319 RepID=A0AAV7T6U3_PLEWA|nr:hypothetical protein NDU88_003694 [Pleurodeles waltl]
MEMLKSNLNNAAGLAALRVAAVVCLRRLPETQKVNTFLVVVRVGLQVVPLLVQRAAWAMSARPPLAAKERVSVVPGRGPHVC